jgi:hypothetical protein
MGPFDFWRTGIKLEVVGSDRYSRGEMNKGRAPREIVVLLWEHKHRSLFLAQHQGIVSFCASVSKSKKNMERAENTVLK